jgi:drug/metabolite transporter (DMT)-like permease
MFLSLGGAALANYLWIVALGRTVPSRVALFALIPPIIAAALGPLLLGEAPSGITLAGLFLVISGIAVAYRGRA